VRGLTAVLLLAGVCACPRAPWPPDTSVLLVETPPETLDRRLALSGVAEDVSGNLIEPGLVAIADDGRPVPDLAERIETPDDRTYVFTLREGLRFHDGAPLRADDVVATFESLRDPALGSPLASKYREIRSIDALDPRTVRFTLDHPFAPFLVDLIMGIVPARKQAAPGAHGFGHDPIGAGPFRFVAWPDEEHLLLAANPDYWGGKPPIGHLLVQTVRDETTRALQLMHGKADFCINAISPPLYGVLGQSANLDILSVPGANTSYLMFQLDDPVLRDARVREAVARAVDRPAIVRYKFLGHAVLGASLLPPGNWALDEELVPPPYDPTGAARLLDEAGHPKPADGPRFTLNYRTSTDRFRRSIAQVIAHELEQVGIAVRLTPLEFGTFFQEIRKGSFQLASLRWPVIEPDLFSWVFASWSIPTPENGYSGANRGHYRNAQLDALLERARSEGNTLDRRETYLAAQRLLARELPYVILWHEDSTAVVRRGYQDFHVSPFGHFSTLAKVRPPAAEQSAARGLTP
jgi:peptide/nickel transport system substrate-binding protein